VVTNVSDEIPDPIFSLKVEDLRFYDTLVTIYQSASSLIGEECGPLSSSFKKKPDLYTHSRENNIFENI
jgi:hypothetical protein